MKKLIHLSFILITLFALTTCKKDESKKTICLVTVMKIKYDNQVDSIMYSYDDQGRLVKTEIDEGWYTTYQYGTNKVTEKSYQNGTLSYTNVYTLNFDGYAMTSTHTLAGNTDPESTTTYDFDSEGYLISTTEVQEDDHNDVVAINYEYEDGNLVYRENIHDKTSFYSETEYEYYLDKPDKFNNFFPFKGKQNVNLVRQATYTSGTINRITNYSYDINKAGYVLKEIETIGTIIWEIEYKYNCD
jgi:YD repeat-containing protein